MHCENIYCVFYETGHCVLKTAHLDIAGRCTNCEYLPLTGHELTLARQRYREENEIPLSRVLSENSLPPKK